MIRVALVLLLAGCTSAAKHETTSLQCLGLCTFTNVNHDSRKAEKVEPVSPVVPATSPEVTTQEIQQ